MSEQPFESETHQPKGERSSRKTNGHDKQANGGDTRAWFIAAARPLVYFKDFDRVAKFDWLIKGVFARGHTSFLIGPPGCGKSALIGSAAAYLGSDQEAWHGFKIKKRSAAVYFAFERAALTQKRIWAEAQRDGLGDVSVSVSPGIINLMNPKCVDMIVGTVLAAEDKFGLEVNFLCIDTYNKGIAAGGGDENTAKDQNIAWGHLRDVHEVLARWHTVHIAAAGHTGKDEKRGARGSNAAEGDNDLTMQIRSGQTKEVEVIKANELPLGSIMAFKMQPHDTGLLDEDGEAIKVWLASKETIDPGPTRSNAKSLSKGLAKFRDVIANAILVGGRDHRPGGDGPLCKAVAVEAARAIHQTKYAHDGEGDRNEAERKAWRRNFKQAADNNLISTEVVNGTELVWLVKTEG
jgi:hypothetical protein